jgi:peptide/nickel transport system permease protein
MIEAINQRVSRNQRIVLAKYWSQIRDWTKTFAKDRMTLVATGVVCFFIVMAIFAPFLAPHSPTDTVYRDDGSVASLDEPNQRFPMGTNHLGQDIFSQWIYGAQVSLIVALFSGLSVITIGTVVGLVSGYYKGVIDLILMRVVDILYAIPATPLVLVVALFFGSSVWNVIIAMILVLWRTMARLVRAQTLTLSEQPFVKTAKAAGAGDLRILFVHIAPVLVPIMLIEGTFVMGAAIILEAGVSFLGLGATEMMSWGVMLQLTFSSGAIATAWWWVLPPGISITMLVVSFFYMSRGIEAVTNPQLRNQ